MLAIAAFVRFISLLDGTLVQAPFFASVARRQTQ